MIKLRCVCGKIIQTRAAAGTIVLAPCCQAKVRVPGAVPAAQAAPAVAATSSRPQQPSSSLFDNLPLATSAGQQPVRPLAAAPAAATPRRQASRRAAAPRQRLPRFGLLHETFGVPFLVGFGVVLFGICVTAAGFIFLQANEFSAKAAASETWPSVPGKIISADYSTRISRKKPTATINIGYSFDVDNQSYSGTTLAFEKLDSLSVGAAQRRLEPYPAGGDCKVFYDPENPGHNVLENGVQSSNMGLMLGALVFLIGGLIGLYDGIAGAINVSRFPQPAQ